MNRDIYRFNNELSDIAKEYIVYFVFAKEFGWTKEQVDEMEEEYIVALLELIEWSKREEEKALKGETRQWLKPPSALK